MYKAIWEVFPAIKFLLNHLEEVKIIYQNYGEFYEVLLGKTRRRCHFRISSSSFFNEDLNDVSWRYLRTTLNNAWKKLDYYYKFTDFFCLRYLNSPSSGPQMAV